MVGPDEATATREADTRLRHAVPQRQVDTALGGGLNRESVGEREFFGARNRQTTLTGGVAEVVGLGANEEMRGAHTTCDVADMTEDQSVRNGLTNLPREPVRVDPMQRAADTVGKCPMSVTIAPRTGPQPASRGPFDTIPELCFNSGALRLARLSESWPPRLSLNPIQTVNRTYIIRTCMYCSEFCERRFGVCPEITTVRTHDAIPINSSSGTPVRSITDRAISGRGDAA